MASSSEAAVGIAFVVEDTSSVAAAVVDMPLVVSVVDIQTVGTVEVAADRVVIDIHQHSLGQSHQ